MCSEFDSCKGRDGKCYFPLWVVLETMYSLFLFALWLLLFGNSGVGKLWFICWFCFCFS